MDVEKIQKINDLALKLQQQAGMSREEAAKQAELMLSKNNDLQISEISPQKLQELETKPKPAETNISWQEAMKKNTDYVVKQFKDIQREIINIKAEMDTLKTHIKNLKTAPPPPLKVETQKELSEKPKGPEQPKEHPRQGTTKPEDVSIEKMFYFGNKR